MENSTGFTIIELIVVVVIISVLAAVIINNVMGYVVKGKDSAAEGNLDSMFKNSLVYYADSSGGNGSYYLWIIDDGSSGAPGYMAAYQALTNAGYTPSNYQTGCDFESGGNDKCALNSQAWCASIKLKQYSTATYYCVDSTGKKEKTSGQCTFGTGTAACP